jgi:hypothetical protein
MRPPACAVSVGERLHFPTSRDLQFFLCFRCNAAIFWGEEVIPYEMVHRIRNGLLGYLDMVV